MPNQSPFNADKPTKSVTRNPTGLAEICLAALKNLEPLEDLPVPTATRVTPPPLPTLQLVYFQQEDSKSARR